MCVSVTECVCVCVCGGGAVCVSVCSVCVATRRDKILRFIKTLIVITGITISSYTDRTDADFTT